jgi:hypothetical protein
MKTLRRRHYSFLQGTPFMIWIMVLGPFDSIINDSLTIGTVLLAFTIKRQLSQSWCFSHSKTMRDKVYSCYILPQFSLLNKVLKSHACNINGSLTGDTLVLPFTWKRRCWTQIMFFLEREAVFPLNVNSTYSDKQPACPSCFEHKWFS